MTRGGYRGGRSRRGCANKSVTDWVSVVGTTLSPEVAKWLKYQKKHGRKMNVLIDTAVRLLIEREKNDARFSNNNNIQ